MIEIKKVTKTYNPKSHNANTVLDHASLTLPDHGLVCIVGKSGIGKSTILNAIGGLMKFDGEILFDGKKENIETYRRKNIGYIFQDFLLFPQLSVKDNIRIGLEISGIYDEKETLRRTKILLKAVGLNINPNRSAGALSLGQRQRVSIARALASNPKILLCDEPTGNLDSKTSITIMRILKNLSKNHLILIVTHNLNLVNLFADKAYAIEDKVFHEINPKDGKIDEIYVKSQINVSQLTQKDIQSEHILLRLYSDPNCPEGEISIIYRDGKFLVIGDKVEVADKSEVHLITQEEKSEELPQGEPSPEKLEDIDFDTLETRPTFRDTGFFRQLKSIFSQPRNKKSVRFRKRFAMAMELLIPILVFLHLNYTLGISAFTSSLIGTYENIDHMVALVNDGQTYQFHVSDFTELLEKKESTHIIDLPFDNAAIFKESTGLFTSSYGYSTNNSVTVSNQFVQENPLSDEEDEIRAEKNYGITLKSSSFSALEKMPVTASHLQGNSLSVEVICDNIEDYAKMDSRLAKYNLKDNEIVLDSSVCQALFYDNNFLSGTVADNLLNTTIRISKTSPNMNYSLSEEYTIVGIEDTGFKAMFATPNTTSFLRQNNYENTAFLCDIQDYDILDYDEAVLNSDYEFTSETTDNSSADTDSGSDKVDSSTSPILYGYLSEEAKASLASTYNGLYLQNKLEASNLTVTKKSDPTKKVLVLQNKDSLNSYSAFYNLYLSDAVKTHSVLDENQTADYRIPSALANKFKANEIQLTSYETYDSADVYAPIYISKKVQLELLKDHYQDCRRFELGNRSNDGRIYSSYLSYYFFLSDDPNKTISYFENNVEKYHMEAYRLSELRDKYVRISQSEILSSYMVSVFTLTLVFLLIVVMDGISAINKEKYRIGVLRALGMPSSSIVREQLEKTLATTLAFCLLPTLVILACLSFFNLYFLSWYYLLFLAAYYLLTVLAELIPLLIVLAKKPIDILHTLN